MATEMPRTSVVICAYTLDRWTDLVAAVRSIETQDVRPTEIVVVIDHNPPLLERARQEFPGVVAIENREERGLSGARNSALEVVSGDVVAFLDDDAVAEPSWIRELGEGYVDGRVLGVGGSIYPLWLSGRPPWFPDEFDWVVGCTYRGMPTEDTPVRNLIGANMSFRRKVFEAVGGFRSGIGRVGTLPMGCEETELCIRAQTRWPDSYWLFKPDARVEHRVPGNRAQLRYFLARCVAEGISKAVVADLVGSNQGLSSEREYTMRVLPLGVARGIVDGIVRRDPWGPARAGAIVAGLLITSAGFAFGKMRGTGKRSITSGIG